MTTFASRGIVDRVRDRLPEPLSGAWRGREYRYSAREVPALPQWSTGSTTRLVIGPANFANQGHGLVMVARGLGVDAINMQTVADDSFGFDADLNVPVRVQRFSRRWQEAHFRWVSETATHVIVETGRPLFGTLFGSDPIAEVRALAAAGVCVATIAYGSDLRLPSRHRLIDEWSPFHDVEWAEIPQFEAQALRYRDLVRATEGPAFVVTPELLLDWPEAVWSPLVVDVERFHTDRPVLQRERPVVLHAPTKSAFKGTRFIEPVLEALEREGLIEYRRLARVAASQMPAAYADADIVLDQFALGIYATTSVEAMAAGRLTFAHLHEQVLDVVSSRAGGEPPIVSVAPDGLDAALRDVVRDRDTYIERAQQGPAFVERLHNGAASAHALAPFLGV